MANTNVPGQIIQKPPVSVGPTVGPGSSGPPAPVPPPQSGIPPYVAQPPLILTKFQFRKLFTMAERIAIDNIQYNPSAPGSVKAVVNTMQIDLNVSGEVDLHLKDTNDGIRYLAAVGLLTPARATRILANLPPL